MLDFVYLALTLVVFAGLALLVGVLDRRVTPRSGAVPQTAAPLDQTHAQPQDQQAPTPSTDGRSTR